jgi:hypothetical protein
MRAFARQGRWRPTPRFYAAGEVTDFALVAFYDTNYGYVRPRQGPPEARAVFFVPQMQVA